MLSHDKIIFHMLFGAFHNTSRISNGPYDGDSDVDDIVINHLSCHDRTSISVFAAGIYIFEVPKPRTNLVRPRPILDAFELNKSESDCRT